MGHITPKDALMPASCDEQLVWIVFHWPRQQHSGSANCQGVAGPRPIPLRQQISAHVVGRVGPIRLRRCPVGCGFGHRQGCFGIFEIGTGGTEVRPSPSFV